MSWAALAATPAHAAAGVAVVMPWLAMAALAAGLATGVYAAGKKAAPVWRAGFLIFLGAVTAVATTFAGSMEAAPLAQVLAAASGVLPFTGGFFGTRWAVTRWRQRQGQGQGKRLD